MGPALYLELHMGSLSQGLGCDPSGTVLNCACVWAGRGDVGPERKHVRGTGCGLRRRRGQAESGAWGQPGL